METKKIVKLGDLCKKVKRGASTLERMDGTISVRVIDVANITDNNQIDRTSSQWIKVQESAPIAENQLKAGDIIIDVREPEKIAIVPQEAEGCVVSSWCIALELDQSVIDPRVVVAYLQLPQITAFLQRKSKCLPYVHAEKVKNILNLTMMVPNTDQQKHLVELMDLTVEQKIQITSEINLLDRMVRASVAKYAGGAFA